MEDIRRQFQESSIEFLQKSAAELEKQEAVSKEFLQEVFRRLHTLKGAAQTFDLNRTSRLAHELENVLESVKEQPELEKERKNLLAEGFEYLTRSLTETDFTVPDSYVRTLAKLSAQKSPTADVYLTLIPPEIFDQLTEFEKLKLKAVTSKDKSLVCIDAVFSLENFTEKLREMQAVLSAKGEIIFTLPSEKQLAENEIGFQIFYSSNEKIEVVRNALRDFKAEAKTMTAPAHFTNDLSGVLSKIVSKGKIWAGALGKKARFKVLSDEPRLEPKFLNLVFEILLHLVKNAVDHSIEKTGNIEIRLKETEDGINLTLTDDGRGIDLHVVRAKAIELKLIRPDTNLTEQETLDLIFLPGFSTAETISAISGRGVGLDAVQNLVVNAKGTISVESQKGKGTAFEIFLPF